MELIKDEIDIVLYHGSCSDGFGSAFVVWLYYKNNFGLGKANSINYLPCYHKSESNSEPTKLDSEYLDMMKGKNILMCDFSYKYDQLVQLIKIAKSFKIIDHHKTAYHDLKSIASDLKIFDMDHSGVGLVWNYFFPDDSLPKFLAHIQDRDIWTYAIPSTLEFITYFFEQDHDFELWETFLDDTNVSKAIATGKEWLQYKNVIVDKIVKKASCIIQKVNNKYCIVAYCNSGELKSDIGSRIFKHFPFADFSCVWNYNLYQNQTNYSLRSTNKRYDVSIIAKKFGGGGHRNASGINFNSVVEHLPFDRVDDFGIVSLLMHGKKTKIENNTRIQSYVIFKVQQLRKEWLEQDYFDLIKRKYDDCAYIVFQRQLDSVTVNAKLDVLPMKEYNLFYNELACDDPEKKLQYFACASKDNFISFESEKNFDEIIKSLIH